MNKYTSECQRCGTAIRGKDIRRFSLKMTGVDWKTVMETTLYLYCHSCAEGLVDVIDRYIEDVTK